MEEEKEEEKREIVSSGERGLSKAVSGLVIRGLDLAKDVELSHDPEQIQSHFSRAIGLYSEKKYEEAEKKLRQFVSYTDIGLFNDLNLGNIARILLGRCLFDQGKYSEAEIVSRESIERGVFVVDFRCLLGCSVMLQLRLSEAEREFRSALRMDPNSNKAHNGLGTVFFLRKQYDEAINEHTKAVQLQPNSEGYSHLGMVLSTTGRYKEAAKAYREAIRLEPNGTEVRVSFGEMLLKKGDLKEAVKVLLDALKIKHDCTSTLFVLASALDKRGKRKEARKYWEKLSELKVQPDRVDLIKHRLSAPD